MTPHRAAACILETLLLGSLDDASRDREAVTVGQLRELARRLRDGDDEGRLPGEHGHAPPPPAPVI